MISLDVIRYPVENLHGHLVLWHKSTNRVFVVDSDNEKYREHNESTGAPVGDWTEYVLFDYLGWSAYRLTIKE